MRKPFPMSPNYLVDEEGNIYGLNGKKLSPSLRGKYLSCSILIDGKPKRLSVHRMVALTFIDNPKKLSQVNHIDGNKLNNRVSNLEWCSPKYNQRHRREILNKNSDRPVICVETNRIFPQIKSAAKAIGSYDSNIIRACQKGSTAKGFHWNYVGGISDGN